METKKLYGCIVMSDLIGHSWLMATKDDILHSDTGEVLADIVKRVGDVLIISFHPSNLGILNVVQR